MRPGAASIASPDFTGSLLLCDRDRESVLAGCAVDLKNRSDLGWKLEVQEIRIGSGHRGRIRDVDCQLVYRAGKPCNGTHHCRHAIAVEPVDVDVRRKLRHRVAVRERHWTHAGREDCNLVAQRGGVRGRVQRAVFVQNVTLTGAAAIAGTATPPNRNWASLPNPVPRMTIVSPAEIGSSSRLAALSAASIRNDGKAAGCTLLPQTVPWSVAPPSTMLPFDPIARPVTPKYSPSPK